jgi:hypothetical protein
MLRLNSLIAPCVLALVMNGGAVEAAGYGGGWHGASWHRDTNYGRYNGGYYGGYGPGYVAIPGLPTESVSMVAAPKPPDPLVPPSLALSCHHSQETIAVPVESGGERKITITRC